jgi:hypothetical protein
METVKYDVSVMDREKLITAWLDPKAKTETINGDITNMMWCEEEVTRIAKKGINAIIVKGSNNKIALLRV